LENAGHKEVAAIGDYTIEHIMPQNANLPSKWKNELGESWKYVHAKYLHTIGNLTLTGYNSELSDRSFLQKRDMKGGFARSPIRLNSGLATLEHWTEIEILQRAEALADRATAIWLSPKLPADVVARYRKVRTGLDSEGYTLEDHRYLCGEMRPLFDQLRRRILDLDASVSEQILKVSLAYRSGSNFVDIAPQKSRLLLSLDVSLDEVIDPRHWCKEVIRVVHLGNGAVEFCVSSAADLDYALFLVRQSFEKQTQDADGWTLPLEEHIAVGPDAFVR
jgi:predicted transport protein